MHAFGVLFDDRRIHSLSPGRHKVDYRSCQRSDSVVTAGLALTGRYLWTRLLKSVSRSRCGCSSMVEHQLPKLNTRVRFPSPA